MNSSFSPVVNAYSSAKVRDAASRIRLACFDVDGTLTDGRLTFDDQGRELKSFHSHDGQGLVLLMRGGIEVALITARVSNVVVRRAAELGISRVHGGSKDKLAAVRAIAAEMGIGMDEVAFMGDDVPDLRAMREVGLSVAPSDAHLWTLEEAMWRTTAKAGRGAVRELCDVILEAQGLVAELLNGIVQADAPVDPNKVAPFVVPAESGDAQ